jgi:hypothetical protein
MKPGDQVDRYLIEAELGRGGMGEVFEALDTRLARRVALKLLRGDADGLGTQRMLREARAAAAFEHPNAVVVFDVGETLGSTFIAMELVRGKPLRSYVGDETLSTSRKIRWLVDAARALGAAHRAGLVHRDVKPDNVMIREDGAVKVLDFGIARRKSGAIDPSAPTESGAVPTLTERGTVVGTPLYASPEQLRSDAIDGRSDQFSWAVMAYELLSGETPWRRTGDSVALISQILSSEPPLLSAKAPDVPDEVVAAVHRALAKLATDRHETMDDLAAVLEPFAEVGGAQVASGRRRASGDSFAPPAAATPPPTQVAKIARRTGRVAFWVLATFGGLIVALLTVAGITGNVNLKLDSNDKPKASTVVSALGCGDAKLTGEGASPDLARAIGIGACARVATDLGVDWRVGPLPGAPAGGRLAPATPLEVEAKLSKDGVEITLAIAGRRSTGKAQTPFDAVAEATPALAKQLELPPMSEAEIKAWGAKDAAGARRIERVWRRIVLNTSPDHDAAIKELIKSDADSPWPHAFAALVWMRGAEATEAARKKALELVGKLPPARAKGLRGVLLFIASEADRKEALNLLRSAYTEDPDDADLAGLYAAIAVSANADEAFAVVDRLAERHPTRSIVPLQNAISASNDRDLERDRRYLDKLEQILPETRAWYFSARNLAQQGKITEARAALAFGDRLGLSGTQADATNLQEARIFVEFAALEPKAARDLAKSMLGDPRVQISSAGAHFTIASYWLEGRVDHALTAEMREIERQRGLGSARDAARFVIMHAATLRRFGRPPLDAATLSFAEETLERSKDLSTWSVFALRAELAYGRSDRDPKKAKAELAPVLAELEQKADAAAGADLRARASHRLQLISLVRAVRGDAEAARLWRDAAQAPFRERRGVAFQAGVALEKSGALEEAVAAYKIASDATRMQAHALTFVGARLRLAEVYRALGREADAAKEEAVVNKLWRDADPAARALMRDP